MRRNKFGKLEFANEQEQADYQKKKLNDMREDVYDKRYPKFADGKYDIANFDMSRRSLSSSPSLCAENAALKEKIAKLEKVIAGVKK